MIDILPPELFDAIFGHIHTLDEEAISYYYAVDYNLGINSTKPTTLLSCSLVCQSWLHRTRLLTFNTVYLPDHELSIGVAFGALVAHPLCTFRSHVRRLSLHECCSGQAFWLNSVLPQLALLTNVEDVLIHGARFSQVVEEEWRAGVQLFGPQLKRLDLQSTDFSHVSRMTELVSRCTHLEHLALRYVENSYSAPEGIVRTPPSQFLRSLTIQYGNSISAEFLTWLCPSPGSIKIPAVELDGISFQDVHCISRFLRDIGPSVTSLAIGFADSSTVLTDGQDAFCRVADLTTLTQLETLQFGPLAIYAIHIDQDKAAKHVPRILAKLNSPSLKEIRFYVSMEEVVDLEMIDWESIVSTLNTASYSALEVLSLRPILEEVLEETKAWLDEHVRKKLRRKVEIRCATTY